MEEVTGAEEEPPSAKPAQAGGEAKKRKHAGAGARDKVRGNEDDIIDPKWKSFMAGKHHHHR